MQPWDIDRALADLVEEFRVLSPGATHPMVIRHPVTEQQSLYVSKGFTTKVVGLSCEENKTKLAELFEFVGQEQHCQAHPWRKNQILFWDNRQLIHRASETSPDESYATYRIGVYDDLPFYLDESA